MAISTPVQFDPPVLRESVQRLLKRQPRCMYLTHYGRIGDIDRLVALGCATPAGTGREERLRAALLARYAQDARAHGCRHDASAVADALALDATLNAQGLAIWLERQGL